MADVTRVALTIRRAASAGLGADTAAELAPSRPRSPARSVPWTPASTASRPRLGRLVPHGVVIALEIAGAVLILAGYTLGQLRVLDQHSVLYLVLNLVGSFVLAVIAWVDERWGSCCWRACGRSSRRSAWSTSPLGGAGENLAPNEPGGGEVCPGPGARPAVRR